MWLSLSEWSWLPKARENPCPASIILVRFRVRAN